MLICFEIYTALLFLRNHFKINFSITLSCNSSSSFLSVCVTNWNKHVCITQVRYLCLFNSRWGKKYRFMIFLPMLLRTQWNFAITSKFAAVVGAFEIIAIFATQHLFCLDIFTDLNYGFFVEDFFSPSLIFWLIVSQSFTGNFQIYDDFCFTSFQTKESNIKRLLRKNTG